MERRNWALAVAVVLIFAAYVWPWYNFASPSFGGVPFSYWWVIVWYVIGTVLLGIYALMPDKNGGPEGS